MVDNVIEAQLIAVRKGVYTMYVFKNLEDSTYVMCTKLPNWQTPDVTVGDIGFLNYQIVKAGEEYYNPSTDETIKYLYSNIYFINFVQKSDVVKTNSIII